MIENAFVAVCAGLPASRTWVVKLKVFAVVGVPLSTPAELSDKPVGSAPEATDHVNGSRPLTAFNDWEYSMPVNPFGSDVFEIARGGVPPDGDAILIEKT